MDWNDDGKKDLVLGTLDGYVRIYLNTGTDAAPLFSGYLDLKVGGSSFWIPYATVHVVDWNSDGKKDVLCGEKAFSGGSIRGRVHLLINEGTNAAPIFNSEVFLKDGTEDLDVGCSAPTVADWNRDGKKDLLVGDAGGGIAYFENKGTDAAPLFDGKINLAAGGTTIDVGEYARPDVMDWDNDGVMDILCGRDNGKVTYFQAVGPLTLSDNRLFESTSVSIDLALNAGPANADRNYLILGSVTGTSPGTQLPGGRAVLPLNWDPFTDLVLSLVNTPVFSNFMGKLGANGEATAQLNAPPLPGHAGLVMHFAYCLNNFFDYVSNPAAIEVAP